jgi:hypothetical protein
MKSIIRIGLILLCCTSLFSVVSLAQGDKVGTMSATFLKIGVGARSAGMGNSSVALLSDASVLYWNPASLGLLHQTDVLMTYTQWFQGMRHDFLGIALPTGIGTFGIGGTMFSSGTMTRTEAAPGGGYVETGEFTNTDICGTVGYGIRIYDHTGFGFAAKYILQSLAGKSGNAYAADVGLFSRIAFLDLGVAVRNVGSKIKFVNEKYELPMQIDGGMVLRFLDDAMLLSVSGGSIGEGKTQGSFGGEFRPLRLLALRAGYRTGQEEVTGRLKGLTAGLGLDLKSLRLDYAFNPYGDLGSVHHISLGFSFSSGKSESPEGSEPKPTPSNNQPEEQR